MKKWVVKGVFKEGGDILTALLQNRKIEESARKEFLNPPPISDYLKKMPGDFKESLKRAKEEIEGAIKKDWPIIIHGDYDADGICATAILYKTIAGTLGYSKVAYFIPNRFDHGYGLSRESVGEMAKLAKERFGSSEGLVITVDCGITVEDEVVSAVHESGFRLIITDHHQKKEKDPQAEVVLWDDSLVGSGVALILAIILGLRNEQLISLAGIATVTDLAPLKGFNRSLVKKSLAILTNNPPMGIKSLMDVSGRKNGEFSVYDLGYVIGPRLNASGRLDSAIDSLMLLLESDQAEVDKIAQKLNAVNLDRQAMTQKIYELADGATMSRSDKVIVSASVEFHEGVIGLVAGKLAQKYYKPAIAISISGDTAKGSARSVAGVNIIEILRHFEERFTGLGGHPMAAGFSIKKENLEKFTADFTEYTQEVISAELLVPQLNIDLEIPLSQINVDLFDQINLLKPYGIGNPEPLFLSRDVGVAGSDFVGRDRSHLSLRLFDGSDTYKAIIFDAKNMGLEGLNLGQKLDIVYTASLKEFHGKLSVDLIIKDFDDKK